MNNQKVKIIKDLVHGYIDIDENVARIVDHRSFQRLKSISQLSCHHLFPSANHTRFEHSLGVMHLAIRFFYSLKPCLRGRIQDDGVLRYLLFHLKYAALLHDVGHAPLSHLGEFFYNINEIRMKLLNLNSGVECVFNHGSKHELMSCYIIENNFLGLLAEIAVKEGITLDIEFIYRIITGTQYTHANWHKNIMIDIVNSSSVDVDKIDYLMRDNIMTGYVAPQIQIERLIKSLHIDDESKLTFLPIGLSGLVTVIDARDLLYLWVYNHHTVVYTDFLYQDMIRHLANLSNTTGKSNNYINLDDLFSCDAIAEKYISDDEIRVLFNQEYVSSNSDYSGRVLPQILERKFLKPLWKTIHEFEEYLDNSFDKRAKERIVKDVTNDQSGYRHKIVKQLISQTDLKEGEVFIIKRSNKFYSMSHEAEFYIYYPGKGNEKLSNIIPQRSYQTNYRDVAFYVFCRRDKFENVLTKLTEILKKASYR